MSEAGRNPAQAQAQDQVDFVSERSQRPAVVLLSGGLDSATVLAIARAEGFACHALSFRYGQRHHAELRAAQRVAAAQGVLSHRWVDLNLADLARNTPPGAFQGSALLDGSIEVPKDRQEEGMNSGIPVTYVPARNTIFLAYALALAEVIGSSDLFIGVNAVDYSGYPDCRPQFVRAFETLANLATKAGVEGQRLRVRSPLIDLPKPRIIRWGLKLGVDYGLTHSCYDPGPEGEPCGRCDSCHLRLAAFAELGMSDPIYERFGLQPPPDP